MKYASFLLVFGIVASELLARLLVPSQSQFEVQEDSWYHVFESGCSFYETNEFKYRRCFNLLGLPGREPGAAGNGAKRLIALGDSFTEGVGAPMDSSWPALLQLKLPHWQCINAGVSGSDVFFNYTLLRDKLIQYHPQTAILLLNVSDLADITIRGGIERFLPDSTTSYRVKPPWWDHTAFSRRLFAKPYPVDTAYALREISTGIELISNLCEEHNIRFIVMLLEDSGLLKIEQYCRDANIELMTISLADSLFWKEDRHCNGRGYEEISSRVYDQLRDTDR